MSNDMLLVNQRFDVKTFGVSCLTSKFDLSNLKMKILHANIRSYRWSSLMIHIPFLLWFMYRFVQYMIYILFFNDSYMFFFAHSTWVWTHGLVFNANCSISGYTASNPVGCWNSLPPLRHFAWHWARYWTGQALLYCCALYSFPSRISSVGILHWPGLTL